MLCLLFFKKIIYITGGIAMKKRKGFKNKISFKLLGLIFLLIAVVSIAIGTTSYHYAKKELITSGKLDLAHLTEAAIEVLEVLNDDVEQGTLTLEDAQEKARTILSGPVGTDGNGVHDYSQSSFVYKDEGYLFAYDSDHKVTLHPVIPLNEDRTDFKNNKGQYVVKDLVGIANSSSYEDHFYTYSWINKEGEKEREKISYVSYFAPWDWSLGIGAYTDEFYEPLASLKFIVLALTIAAIVLGTGIFYFATKKMFVSLGVVSQTSLRIAEGDLTGEPLVESENEIGQLGMSYNHMTTNLRELLVDVQKTSESLVTSASELSAVSEETSAGSDEIGVAMTEITTGTIDQATNLEDTNQSLGQLISSVEKMNNQNQQIKKISTTSKEATVKGQDIVVVLKKSNDESKVASDQISIGVTNLYKKLIDISTMTDAIANVSDQTNLLALNASIEAARAGEHGKGFAVVAEEVKKLAEESSVSTKQIREMIVGIEKEIEETVTAMAMTMSISTQLDGAVNDTESEFNKIATTVQEMAEAMEVLNAEIHQVTEHSSVISDAIQNVSAIAEETAASAEEVTASVDEQSQAIHSVTALAQGLTDLSEKVNETIAKYRL